MVPGINDSHTHTALYGSSRPPLTLDLQHPAVHSIADIKEAVRQRAEAIKPGEWIRGNGWDYGYLAESLADRGRDRLASISTKWRRTIPFWSTSANTGSWPTAWRLNWRVSLVIRRVSRALRSSKTRPPENPLGCWWSYRLRASS